MATVNTAGPLNSDRYELPAWFWLFLPPLLYFGHYFFCAILPTPVYNAWFTTETGSTEALTVAFLVGAALAAGAVAVHFYLSDRRHLALWFGLMVLGCVYFGGEEASWGQHWFGWTSPELFQQINGQDETNLHNTSGWVGGLVDQLPRNLLGLAALVAGGILPLWRRARGRRLTYDTRAYWLLPTMVCVPVGLFASLGSIPEKIMEAAAGGTAPINIEAGEVKELLLALFLLTYALSVWRRRHSDGSTQSGSG